MVHLKGRHHPLRDDGSWGSVEVSLLANIGPRVRAEPIELECGIKVVGSGEAEERPCWDFFLGRMPFFLAQSRTSGEALSVI